MRLILFSVVLLLSGCATTSSGGSENINYEPIGQEELLTAGVRNAEQAVRKLRPGWELRQPYQTGMQVVRGDGGQAWACYTDLPTLLYVDGRKWGQRPTGFSSLSRIAVQNIKEIHYIRRSDPRPDGEMRCRGLPSIHVILNPWQESPKGSSY